MKTQALLVAGLLAAVSAFGQFVSVPTPASLVLTGGAGGASTNLSLGWSSSTIITNVVQAWSPTSSPPVMLMSTNYSTNTVTAFADIDALGQDYITLQHTFNCNTLNSNEWYAVARSVDKVAWDTTGNLFRTNTSVGSTNVSDMYQIDMRGYPYGRIMSINWSNTSASCTWTNGGAPIVVNGVTNQEPGFRYWKTARRTTGN